MELNVYPKYYKFLPHECPCDFHFADYMKNNLNNKNIFHFGTGGHHYIGLENNKLDSPNDILGITAQKEEYISYMDLIIENAHLNSHYKVIFSDIYTFSPQCLPNFDIITLFHLCEYYYKDKSDYCNLDDRTLLDLMIDKLNNGGNIIFYKKSAKYELAKKLINDTPNLIWEKDFKTLSFYKKIT